MTPQEQASAIARARRRRAEAERSPDARALDQSIRESKPPSMLMDALQSAGSGLVRGVGETLMLPTTIKRGINYLMGGREAPGSMVGVEGRGQDRIRQRMDETLHAPTTTVGEFAQTGGEFAGGAAIGGPGGIVGRTLKYGVVPGLASEAAGQLTEGSAIEPWARIGTALITGGGMAAIPTKAPNAVLGRELRNATAADINAAETLVNQSRQMGIELTWPEAMAKATNGRVDLTGVQRVLEQTPGGARQQLRTVMAERPGQVQRAFDATANTIGRAGIPTVVGPALQRAGTAYIEGINTQINNMTDHLMQAGRSATVDPVAFSHLKSDPVFQEALTAVRRDKAHSRFIEYMPDDSVATLNEVRKWLRQQADNAAAGTTPRGTARQRASVYGGVASDAENAARGASPDFSNWLDRQAVLRQNVLDPAARNPLGRARETSDLGRQLNLMFTKAPIQGSDQSIAQAVNALVRQDPDLAGTVIRSHLTRAFDQATAQLTKGPNEWGGAAFRAAIAGNRQQLQNLRSAVRQLPQGDVRWAGLEKLLDVLEATGRRQSRGSPTAETGQIINALGRGTAPGQAAVVATSPNRWLGLVDGFYKTFRLGRNSDQLARIITDPRSGDLLRRLVNAKTNEEAIQAAGLLIYQTSEQAQGRLGNEAWRNAPRLPAQ